MLFLTYSTTLRLDGSLHWCHVKEKWVLQFSVVWSGAGGHDGCTTAASMHLAIPSSPAWIPSSYHCCSFLRVAMNEGRSCFPLTLAAVGILLFPAHILNTPSGWYWTCTFDLLLKCSAWSMLTTWNFILRGDAETYHFSSTVLSIHAHNIWKPTYLNTNNPWTYPPSEWRSD